MTTVLLILAATALGAVLTDVICRLVAVWRMGREWSDELLHAEED